MVADDRIDGEWIRQRLSGSGKTQRQLASSLGIDASGVSRLLDGSRAIKVDEIGVVRAFFDKATVTSTIDGDAPSDEREFENSNRRSRPGPRPRTRFRDDLPLYATDPSGHPPFWQMSKSPPVEYRACPPQLAGVSGAFAIYVPDDSLSPRIRSGEVIYIHPTKPPNAGSDVFVTLRSANGRFALLRFLAHDGERLHFSSMNGTRTADGHLPKASMVLNRAEILQIGTIVLISSC